MRFAGGRGEECACTRSDSTSKAAPRCCGSVELPDPVPGLGQVLVRVAYAGVNYGEVQHRARATSAARARRRRACPASRSPARSPRSAGRRRARGRRPGRRLPPRRRRIRRIRRRARPSSPSRSTGCSLRDGGGAALVLTTAYGVLTGAARLAGRRHRPDPRGGRRGRLRRRPDRPRAGRRRRLRHRRLGGEGRVRQALRLRRRPPRATPSPTSVRELDVVLDPVGGPTRLASLGRCSRPSAGWPSTGRRRAQPDLTCRYCRCGRATAR